jgi:hypothetical protein
MSNPTPAPAEYVQSLKQMTDYMNTTVTHWDSEAKRLQSLSVEAGKKRDAAMTARNGLTAVLALEA